MRITSRVVALVLGASFALAACGGHGAALVPVTSQPAASEISVPKTAGTLAYTDAGRRDPEAPVSVSLTLAYGDQAGLDRFVEAVSDPHSGSYRHFLTPHEFSERYAPSVAQERSVVNALEHAGFTITKRFSNRTIVDASGPSATVERFFSTEMHDVRQGRYGQRFANVTPATVPNSIASLVRAASLSNVVVVRTLAERTSASLAMKNRPDVPCSGQLLYNPGFESGNVDWSTTPDVIVKNRDDAYSGSWFAYLDGHDTTQTDTLQQTVSVPARCAATLTYDLYVGTDERKQSALDTLKLTVNGATEQSFSNLTTTGGTYVTESVNLTAFAGKNVTIVWTSKQTGSQPTEFFIDSTALTLSGGYATPTPRPPPTATPHPTATPTATVMPTATAIPTATATPTATPTGGAACNGAPLDNGPLGTSNGTLATGVAKPFDYPVQHGCNGAGYTAAIVIDDPVNTSYVSQYLTASGVTHTGTITNEAVDGGGSGDDPETDLDVQTIAGLAPGANVIVYDTGSLSDQAIEDAYDQVLTDGVAAVVNSSFGGCESSDPSFESSTNAIAEQGAAEGIGFFASAGDTGSDECGNFNAEGVSAPAGDPYFTSVGGVNFSENASGVLQTVTAGDTGCVGGVNNACYGGGGVSTIVSLPSFQSGVPGVITSGRNQPDISLPFDPVVVYSGSGAQGMLGTSWSSPAAVALFIEADELHGSKLGWLNPTLYSLFTSTGYASYFTPCTSGNIIAYTCSATQYNQAAGIGAPKGYALAQAL